jgi:hypothetical protein
MQYDTFVETLDVFPSGRYIVNSCQLLDLLNHQGCQGACVRVLHIGTIGLDVSEIAERLKMDQHPRLDDIKITCLDGVIIIDEPSHGAS